MDINQLRDPLKASAIAGIAVVSLSIAYFLVIYLPARERRKFDLQEKELSLRRQEIERAANEREQTLKENKELARLKISETRKEAARREQAAQQKTQRQVACLDSADERYKQNWATACINDVDRVKQGLRACLSIATMQSTVDLCEARWQIPNGASDCALPTGTADRLNESRRAMRDECLKLFPSD